MLVDITNKQGLLLDIRYASSNNFTGQTIYSQPKLYLHKQAALLLDKAIEIASKCGYQLKVFDGFRPSSAQYKLWEHTPNPNFITPPDKGSPHTRGVAVDLTLCDENGKELDLGTDFDDFTAKSFHSNLEISKKAQINRKILLGIMTAAGWDYFENEWWHYQLHHPRGYPLIDGFEI